MAASLGEATEEDWDTEFLALVLAVRVVDSLEEAIEHVNAHGSGHSEAIVTARRGGRARVRARRRRRVRLRQRLDALHRRRRVRHGRRDRQLDPEAPRARADRAARAVHVQVRRARATGTSGPDRARPASSAGRSTRRTSATSCAPQEARCPARAGPRAADAGRRAAAQGGARRPRRRRSGWSCAAWRSRATDGCRCPTWRSPRGGPSYTVDTLRALHARRPEDDLTFIVGGDMAHQPAHVARARGGAAARDARRRASARASVAPTSSTGSSRWGRPVACGSSTCRASTSRPRTSARRVAAGAPIRYLVPDCGRRAHRPAAGSTAGAGA